MDDNDAPQGGKDVTLLSGEHDTDPPCDLSTSLRTVKALESNGMCNVCKQLATGEALQCYICSEFFHAINCANNTQLCSRSFFENNWPSLNK